MNLGDTVLVKAYGNKELTRRVAALGEGVIYVCRDEEYLSAQKQGREPICVGIREKDVLTLSR